MVTNVILTAKCEEKKAAERLARIEHEKREQEFNQAAENEKQSLAEYDAARAQRAETEENSRTSQHYRRKSARAERNHRIFAIPERKFSQGR